MKRLRPWDVLDHLLLAALILALTAALWPQPAFFRAVFP
jgi:hypothetical protein